MSTSGQLPNAQVGWWNIPDLCQQEVVTDKMGHPVLETHPFSGQLFNFTAMLTDLHLRAVAGRLRRPPEAAPRRKARGHPEGLLRRRRDLLQGGGEEQMMNQQVSANPVGEIFFKVNCSIFSCDFQERGEDKRTFSVVVA